jgi:hypothetical protein
MSFKVYALAAVMALMTNASAMAQAGSGSGAAVSEKSGQAVNGGSAAVGTIETNRPRQTTGQNARDPNSGNPNGTAGGPTSLSGTGSSQYGGTGTAGTSNGR